MKYKKILSGVLALSLLTEMFPVGITVAADTPTTITQTNTSGTLTITLVIGEHEHSWGYSAGTGDTANVITATCNGTTGTCSVGDQTATLTLDKSSYSYGDTITPTVTLSDGWTAANGFTTIPTTANVTYVGRGTTTYNSTTAPVNVGTYTAQLTVGTATAAVDFEITAGTISASAENVTAGYDGEPHGITVNVTAPTSGATITYGNSADGCTLTESPTITNVEDSPKTVYYKVTAPNYADKTGSATITINKAAQNAPEAPTKASATVNSITLTEVDGCEYSKDGTTWQDSPTFTGLSADTEYTFYQRLKGNGNYEPSPASEGTEISTNAHVHDFTYSANDATITATCGNSDGAHTGSLTYDLTITAPEKTAFNDDKAAVATLDGLDDFNTATGLTVSASNISYSGALSDGTAYPASTTAPVNAGDYTASITVGDATATVDYTISKIYPNVQAPTDLSADYGQTLNEVTLPAGWTWQNPQQSVGNAGTNQFKADYTPTDTVNYYSVSGVDVSVDVGTVAPAYTAPEAVQGLEYTGAAQALVTAGSSSDGTMLYSLNGTDYSDSVPTGTTAGSYTVYWKVQGDNNHTDTEVFTISVGITSIDPTIGAPTAIQGLRYTGTAQALVTEGTTDGGTMMYSVDGGSYSSDVPTGTDAKDYYVVSYYIQGDDNYNTTDPQTLNVSIGKADKAAPVLTSENETVAGKGDGKIIGLAEGMQISTTGQEDDYTDITDFSGENYAADTYYIRYKESDNYLASSPKVVTIGAGPQVTITFDTGEGTDIPAITGDFGTAVTAPEDPVKDYAKFDGWDKEIPETIPAENMTITAKWIPLTEVPAVPADCENSGMKLYYTDDNGNIYADNHGLNPTTLDELTVPAKGHTAGAPVQENVVSPTADRSGSYDEVIYCSVCNEELSRTQKTIPAQGQNTPAPSPTPTPSYGPSAPYVPSTPAVTETPTGTGTPVSVTVSSGEHTSPIKDKHIHAKYDGKKSIRLWWDEIDGAENYTVYIIENGKAKPLTETDGTEYTYKKAKAGKSYKFMVKYTTKDGESDKTESYQITVKADNTKPIVTATAKGKKVTLKWSKVPNAKEYAVFRVVNGKLKKVTTTKKRTITINKPGKNEGYAVKALVNGKWTTVTKNDIVTVTSK